MICQVTYDPILEVVVVLDREAAAAARTTLQGASVESERGGHGRGLLRDAAEALANALEDER